MSGTVRVALAQLNCVVGDCPGNADRIVAAMGKAARAGADILVAPELAVTGYPPEDLLFRRDFIAANLAGVARITRASRRHPRTMCAVGCVEWDGGRRFNAAALIRNGRILARFRKQLLPNYGVFDERRYFTPGDLPCVVHVDGFNLGVAICEDLWFPDGPVVGALEAGRADLVVSLNASPYEAGKARTREKLFGGEAARWGAPLAYVNLVGGQDELVFDGGSLVFDARGRVAARGTRFAEDLVVADLRVEHAARRPHPPIAAPKRHEAVPLEEEVWGALVLGVRDYARKNGFKGAVVGLSGGIDSALTAVIAADALGPDRVTGVSLPSRFTSGTSISEARELARRLGINWLEIPIEPMHDAYLGALGPHADGPQADLVRQNIQPRVRATVLMALSNRYGWLLLATGNKSEMSAGYATLYGDMAGGFAALKDVPKTFVYRLARWRNDRKPRGPIPAKTFSRAPTAELKPGQRDTDNLPPYPVLDRMIRLYVEEARPIGEIVKAGIPRKTAERVARMIEVAEFKRRQAPPGVKIQPKAFGRDRRVPITSAFRPWKVGHW